MTVCIIVQFKIYYCTTLLILTIRHENIEIHCLKSNYFLQLFDWLTPQVLHSSGCLEISNKKTMGQTYCLKFSHAVKLLFKFVFWVISLDFTYIEHSVACGLYCFFLFLSVAHWYHLNRINSFYQKLDHMHEQVNSSSLKSVCIWSWKCI